ncbi:MAG: BamA/TamA family outer membrane protein [Bacteroidetes bacterium]|nr:BamA/TamA family outer membrane protein [Bacteroidota bacterium]
MVIGKRITLLFFFSLIIFGEANGQKKGKLEKLLDKVYDKVEGDTSKPNKKYFVALPIWGLYPETGWRLGVSLVYLFHTKKDAITRPSLLRLNGQYTQNHQSSIKPYFDIFTNRNKFNIKGSYTYTKFIENYWGIGNTQTDASKELYDFTLNKMQLRGTYQVYKNVYAGINIETNKMSELGFMDGSAMKSSNILGVNNSFTAGAGVVLSFDNRDHIYYPLHGHLIDISTLFNSKSIGSTYEFNNLTIDARSYIKLWKYNVLALQAFGNFNEGNIPFRQMGTIGSDMFMRGYYNGRFRDNHALSVQAELRKQVWGPISMVLFVGAGNVGNKLSNLMDNIKPNYGIGIRGIAMRKERINLRIDYGRGENGIQGMYFTLGEAF